MLPMHIHQRCADCHPPTHHDTSSQLAEVVFRGCQFGMLAAPPVVPSCSPHLRGPSGVELWFYTPPGAPLSTIPTTAPELRAPRGAGQGEPALPPLPPRSVQPRVWHPGHAPPAWQRRRGQGRAAAGRQFITPQELKNLWTGESV